MARICANAPGRVSQRSVGTLRFHTRFGEHPRWRRGTNVRVGAGAGRFQVGELLLNRALAYALDMPARAHAERIQQGEDLGPFVPIRRGRARGQRQASGVRQTMTQEALALPAIRDALTTPLARGKRSHPPRRSASGSAHALRPAQACAVASRRASHRPASAATTPAQTLGGPLLVPGEITPAAAGDQDVEQRIDDLTKGGRRQATPPLGWSWRKHIGKELPLQVT
jgi:hypothetical protein